MKTKEKTKGAQSPDLGWDVRVGELDQYLFGQGNHYDIYRKLGAHPAVVDGREGVYFAVWAPHAAQVLLVGDFCGWQEADGHAMARLEPLGIYEIFLEGVPVGARYKYLICTADGRRLYKADPFGNQSELRPGTASVVADISHLEWHDGDWMRSRGKHDLDTAPMAIYEVHPGSWMKHPYTEENPAGFYNYRLFAERLTEYVKDMGYTHVELMGIAEHPFDGSWGYQVTGYYAPTSRYGTPEDFAYMVDYFHQNGIGVILDWVPAHFPKDACGLADFDGQPLFEYADPRKGEHPDWGTKVFDFSKNEVRNFLIANALYWVGHFHIDGLRVDAVASMLYLDYGRQAGQWVPNIYGENKNLEAIEFFKHLNSVVPGRHPGVLMIAEESTAWPMVTGAPKDGGLGFSLKWNMGWMHDFLDYMKLDPIYRNYHHNQMTFSMTYAFSERFVLVLSHDEVVHLKCSMINKMPGLYDDKFANLRAGYTYMFAHPGKKLLFMGQDIAQFQEWSEEREIDWYLLGEEKHRQLQHYVRTLIHLYTENPAMHTLDHSWDGFTWVNADDNTRSIYSFIRHSADGQHNLLFAINFTPVAYGGYRVGVPQPGEYQLVLNSDDLAFGGNGNAVPQVLTAQEGACDGHGHFLEFALPAYGAVAYQYRKPSEKIKKEKGEAKKKEEKKKSEKARKGEKAKKESKGKKERKETKAKEQTES